MNIIVSKQKRKYNNVELAFIKKQSFQYKTKLLRLLRQGAIGFYYNDEKINQLKEILKPDFDSNYVTNSGKHLDVYFI